MSPLGGGEPPPPATYDRRMFESFVTAFINYFVVFDPVGNAPIFLVMTQAQDRTYWLHAALEGTAIANSIMLFFALCGP